MKSGGGGLNFQDGNYWRFTFYVAGKKKRLAPDGYPDVSLKAARQARDSTRAVRYCVVGYGMAELPEECGHGHGDMVRAIKSSLVLRRPV